MSEEKKQNTQNINNQVTQARKPHHHHKHRGPKPNPAEKKENGQQKVQENQPHRNEKSSQAPRQQNQGQQAPKSNQPKAVQDDKKREQNDRQGHGKRHNRNQPKGDKKQNRDAQNSESVAAPVETSSFFPGAFDNDIFSFSSKEKKAERAELSPSEIRKLTDEELFGTAHLIHAPVITSEDSTEIVGVRFKVGGKVYYFDPENIAASEGDNVIVDTARGAEFGTVCIPNKKISSSGIVQPLRKVIRIATKEDVAHQNSNKQREKDAFKIGLEKIAAHKLDMKLVDVQYSFDNSKLLFYFTSAGRVDFRELVRDLASVFKTRIELRQIGIRDEAKMLGGIGMCGRSLCCAGHLSNFAQVSIKMAKEQGLSLNANKISGNCGRLMCCLNFENQVYIDEIKITPMPGSVVKIGNEKGTVTDANPLTGMLKVHLDSAAENEKVAIHRDSVTVISKKIAEIQDDNEEMDDQPSEKN